VEFGNDTIDRYPLPYEGRLVKILCITKEVFENLKAAWAEFALKPKRASAKTKPSFRQKPLKKEPQAGSRNDNHKPQKEKATSCFEPSDIFNIQYSSLWKIRNLKAWFKEQESYEDARYLKMYQIKI
jgi:hypothetical protein